MQTTDNKMSREDIDDLKLWATNNATCIFGTLGFFPTDKGKYAHSNCPMQFHPGDASNDKAFTWSFEKGLWACFTHQCHLVTNNDIIGFVQAFNECSFYQAINVLKKIRSDGFDTHIVTKVRPKEQTNHTVKILDKEKLKILLPDNYFKYRNFSETFLKQHKVGYWHKIGTFMHKRAIVPIFDVADRLIGFSGRTTNPNWEKDNESKWVHGIDFINFKAGIFEKSKVLYNANRAKDCIKSSRLCYITEGPIDCCRIEQAGILNVVATLGLGLTQNQFNILVGLGVEKIIICYDNDINGAGINAAEKILEQYKDLLEVQIITPSKKDFGEMNKEEILKELHAV